MRIYLVLEMSDANQPEFLHQQQVTYRVVDMKWSEIAPHQSVLQERKWAVVEIQMPPAEGMAFIRKVGAAQPRIGILVAHAGGGLAQRIQGYEWGADVFLNESVSDMELDAMAQAMVRRLARTPLSEASRYARRP